MKTMYTFKQAKGILYPTHEEAAKMAKFVGVSPSSVYVAHIY